MVVLVGVQKDSEGGPVHPACFSVVGSQGTCSCNRKYVYLRNILGHVLRHVPGMHLDMYLSMPLQT